MRQHCTDGSFRLCRWRAHREALSEDSGPAALSTHGPYVALHVFYAILQPIAGELSAHCCRTITMTRYNKRKLVYEWPALPMTHADGAVGHAVQKTAQRVGRFRPVLGERDLPHGSAMSSARLAPITRRKPFVVHCTVHTPSTDMVAYSINRSDIPSRVRCPRGLTMPSYGHTAVEARHLSTPCAVVCTASTHGGIFLCQRLL